MGEESFEVGYGRVPGRRRACLWVRFGTRHWVLGSFDSPAAAAVFGALEMSCRVPSEPERERLEALLRDGGRDEFAPPPRGGGSEPPGGDSVAPGAEGT